jgi:hypothetical protein
MEVICAAAGKPRTKLTQVPYDRWPFKFKKACRRHKPKIEVLPGDVWRCLDSEITRYRAGTSAARPWAAAGGLVRALPATRKPTPRLLQLIRRKLTSNRGQVSCKLVS